MTTQPSHADLLAILERIEERLGTIEGKVMAYDRLKERVIGALMAGTVLIGIVWWLTKAKLAAVFGVS